jgi:TnpA family transposase
MSSALAYIFARICPLPFSLKQRTAPAHVIVQRLTNSFPSDRLSKAFTNLGRIIKTQYILRYLTDRDLRQTVQLQLNKGEYRHKLPRRIFVIAQPGSNKERTGERAFWMA